MKCLRCGPLIKAIDAYLAKAENDLYEQLTMEGYLKAKESLNTVDEIEEVVTKLLEDNADDLLKELADAIALGEATAKAVQRIPDAHCNGDMHAALDYASKVKHAQREVVSRCGIKSIVE